MANLSRGTGVRGLIVGGANAVTKGRPLDIRVIYQAPDLIGECPRWEEREQRLYWTDINGCAIRRYDPNTGTVESFELPEPVGCFSFRERGGIVAGTQTGFAFIDVDRGGFERLVNPLPDDPAFRMNDGRCDAGGRFWVGSLRVPLVDQAVGKHFRLDPDGKVQQMREGLIGPNGMAFSPDGRTMYWSDSRQDTIWAADYDVPSGTCSNERIFYENDPTEGRPDGAAVDAEGFYWIAYVQGWRVMRIAPDGTVDRVIGVPVQRPTMCAFGGAEMSTLFVTSATHPLPENFRHKQPLAGSLFAIDVGIKGVVEPRFWG